MHVELWVWAVTIAVLGVILLADFVVQLRRPHEPTFRESAIQVSIYITLALLFTFVIGGVWGPQYAAEYIAGWVTEYSQSVDNIFVFLIIFTQFAVPRQLRSQALLIGIAQAIALIPGTSRSGITMTAALMLGLDRVSAARFSFLLSIPIIILSGGYQGSKLLAAPTQYDVSAILLGTGLSFISAFICIHLFLKVIERMGMLPFVIYRLILGIVLLAVLSSAT